MELQNTSLQNEINLCGQIADLLKKYIEDEDLVRPGSFDAIMEEVEIKLHRLQREQG